MIHGLTCCANTDDRYDDADNSDNNTYSVHNNCNPHYVLKAPFRRFLIKITPFGDDSYSSYSFANSSCDPLLFS